MVIGESGIVKVMEGVVPGFNNRINKMQSAIQGYLNGVIEGQKLMTLHLASLQETSDGNKEMNQKMVAYFRHKTNWDFDRCEERTNTTTTSTIAHKDACSPSKDIVSIQDIPGLYQGEPVPVVRIPIPEYCLHTRHRYVSSIWDEWYGQNDFSHDVSITFYAGGIHALELKYKASWRQHFSCGDAKRFSRHKSIITTVKFLICSSEICESDVIAFLDNKCDLDKIHSVTLTQVYLKKNKQQLFQQLVTRTLPMNSFTRTPTNAPTTAPNAPTHTQAPTAPTWGFNPA